MLTTSKKRVKHVSIFLKVILVFELVENLNGFSDAFDSPCFFFSQDEESEEEESEEEIEAEVNPEMMGRGKRSAILASRTRVRESVFWMIFLGCLLAPSFIWCLLGMGKYSAPLLCRSSQYNVVVSCLPTSHC